MKTRDGVAELANRLPMAEISSPLSLVSQVYSLPAVQPRACTVATTFRGSSTPPIAKLQYSKFSGCRFINPRAKRLPISSAFRIAARYPTDVGRSVMTTGHRSFRRPNPKLLDQRRDARRSPSR